MSRLAAARLDIRVPIDALYRAHICHTGVLNRRRLNHCEKCGLERTRIGAMHATWIRRCAPLSGSAANLGLAVALAGWVATMPAGAQTYPAKPIKMIVPYTPGSPVDVLARVVTQAASHELNQAIVLDN